MALQLLPACQSRIVCGHCPLKGGNIMKKIRILALLALLILALCACGKEEAPATAPATEAAAPEATLPVPLTLTDWDMYASTWSSPNGATVHIAATPSRYIEGQSASFIVRLEGEEAANIPCEWDGKQYTAAADLNGANGYCYYIVLNDVYGSVTEVSVNTPTDPRFETLINLEDALNSYCAVVIDDSSVTNTRLVLNSGTIQVQAPKLGNDGQTISCVDVLLIMSLDGEKISKKAMVMQGTDDVGYYTLEMSDVSFDLPQLEGDHQITLDLEVKLSNDQILSAPAGVWYTSDEGLQAAVG